MIPLKAHKETNEIWGGWSGIVTVMLPEINSWKTILEKLLSMKTFEWLEILVGCKVYDIKEFEA